MISINRGGVFASILIAGGMLSLPALARVAKEGAAAAAPPAKGAVAAAPAGERPEVEWFGFEEAEPWRRAQTLNRPILLVVTVRWNRQAAHFLDDVLSRPDVAGVIRSRYVPILVDADLRPDLRSRYPSASWPSVTILTPTGDPVYWRPQGEGARPVRMAVANVAPDKLSAFLEESSTYYRAMSARGGDASFRSALAAELQEEKQAGTVEQTLVDQSADLLRDSVDLIHGGFGTEPKFLTPDAIEACFMFNRLKKDPELLSAATKELRAAGAMFDPVEGGIHRLAGSADWTSLQYEKLLNRNADALEAYTEGFRATVEDEFLLRARQTAGYILKTLSLPSGGFGSAQTADMTSDDGGAYYRAKAEARASLKAPAVLEEMLVSPTARACRALLRYASIAGDPTARERALAALHLLETRLYVSGRGVQHVWVRDIAAGPTLLKDQVDFLGAELEAYEQTGEPARLQIATDVARFIRDNLRDAQTGLLGDRIPQNGGPLLLQRATHPYDDNCEAARQFARLHYFTRKKENVVGPAQIVIKAPEPAAARSSSRESTWGEIARGILDALAPKVASSGPLSAAYALAAEEYLNSPAWIVLVGDVNADPLARNMLDAAYRLDIPFRLRTILDPKRDLETIRAAGLVQHQPPGLYLTKDGLTTWGATGLPDIPKVYDDLVESLKPPDKDEAGEDGTENPPAKSPGKGGPLARPAVAPRSPTPTKPPAAPSGSR